MSATSSSETRSLRPTQAAELRFRQRQRCRRAQAGPLRAAELDEAGDLDLLTGPAVTATS